jgi:hypothetical protein
MTIIECNDQSQGNVIDPHTSFDHGNPRLDDYLLTSTRTLNALTELAGRGEAIGPDSRDWMLAQVDFIVETIGNESLELGDEMRSNLLQLLLAIANLNEHVRHQASLNL